MKLKLNPRSLWTFSLIAYIICSTAFSYGELRKLNTVGLYFFFAVSVLMILKRGRVRIDAGSGAIVGYLVIAFAGMLYTPTSLDDVREVMYYCVTMSVLAVCIVQYIESEKDVHIIIHAYMVAGFVLALYVYSVYGSSFWTIMRNAANTASGSVIRLGGDLTNENTISLATAISAIIASYYLIFARTSKWKMIVCGAIGFFCFLVSMAAASKKGLLLLFVCMFGMWLYSMFGTRNFLRKLRSVLILCCAAAILLWAINTLPIFSGIASRFASLFSFLDGGEGTSSETARFKMITEGLAVWWEHPLIGAGTAASVAYLGVFSHNNIVEILMNSGIVGFAVFYAPYLYAGVNLLKKAALYKRVDKHVIVQFAIFLGIAACSIAMVYYYDRYYMNLLITIFSAVRVYNSKLRKIQRNEIRI